MHTDVAALAAASLGASEKQAGLFDFVTKGATKAVGLFGRGAAKVAPAAAATAAKVAPAAAATAAKAAPAAAATAAKAAPAAAATAMNAAARAAPRSMASRLGRTTLGASAVGAGAVGAGHLNNQYQEYGVKLPFMDRMGGKDPYASFREHQNREKELLQKSTQSLASMVPGSDEYKQQLAATESGGYGASPWSMGGLNPFVDSGLGSHQRIMNDRVSQVSGDHENATNDFANSRRSIGDQMAAIHTRLADRTLRPQQRHFYQTQMDAIQQRLKDMGEQSPAAARIHQRAIDAGMVSKGDPFPAPGDLGAASLGAASATPTPTTPTPATPATPTPAPNSNPLLTGGATGAPLTPTNYRKAPVY